GPNRKSRAHGCQHYQTSLLQLAFLARAVHGKRDRTGGGVSVTVNIDDHALRTQAQALRGGGDDELVGLMWNEHINVAALQIVALEQTLADVGLFAYRELKYRLAILVNVMHFLVHGLVGGRIEATAAGHIKSTAAGAVNFMNKINDAGRVIFARLQQHCTGTVAKNYASGAVGVVNDGRHGVGTDHQHRLMRAGRNELSAGLKSVNKSRARRRQIKSPGPLAPSLCCTTQAVEGKNMSGVTVATMIAPIWSVASPRSASARQAAFTAKSLVATPLSTICRSRIPVRSKIHWSEVSTIFSRSWLVSSRGGT